MHGQRDRDGDRGGDPEGRRDRHFEREQASRDGSQQHRRHGHRATAELRPLAAERGSLRGDPGQRSCRHGVVGGQLRYRQLLGGGVLDAHPERERHQHA